MDTSCDYQDCEIYPNIQLTARLTNQITRYSQRRTGARCSLLKGDVFSPRLPCACNFSGPVRAWLIGKTGLRRKIAFVNAAEPQCSGFLCVAVPHTDEHENRKGSERKGCRAKENATDHQRPFFHATHRALHCTYGPSH